MSEPELIAVLEALPRPGRITVTTAVGEHWQTIGVPIWQDGWPDTAGAASRLRTAGYEPTGRGAHGWRYDARGYTIEVRRS